MLLMSEKRPMVPFALTFYIGLPDLCVECVGLAAGFAVRKVARYVYC